MNVRVRQAADAVQQAVDRVRTWFNPELGADARPLEIRETVLERVVERIEPVGRGRRVLPFNRITVAVLAATKEQRLALEAALDDLDAAVNARLTELRCEIPAGFALTVDYPKRPRAGWAADQWIDVDFARSSSPAPARVDMPVLCINILRGAASRASYRFAERYVQIGRTADPVDQRGRTRENHVAFVEDGDEHSRTVGRAHASIRYVAERREYRLFDEGSRNGTRLVRAGTVLEVGPRDPVGAVLLSGDEIRFGSAAVEVRIEAPPDAQPRRSRSVVHDGQEQRERSDHEGHEDHEA